MQLEDHQQAIAACHGDEQAFLYLIEIHQRKMYGIAFSYLHHEADALDVVQNTVYKAWLKCRRLQDPTRFTPWLFRILIHCCMDKLRRRKKHSAVAVDFFYSSETLEMVNVYRMDLNKAMQHMKPKYRHVLTLRYFQDMTVSDIAMVLNKSEGTIKTWIHQGLKKLRFYMDQGGERYHESF
ncbi:RNA polymerase sigma-70 factor (ECF subfamily) [Paenibacillus shirakamiensis]|uniref:RNA polymerase sigma-70 factor (ECF subfamily) n=1 Tax=Paenibacillus shirakamiensis TaxID=1265935 RepID=A0ABS4JI73_9BACL|nr:sigma-70 family RNA polymerase sigma factor [Paenibacillus shirakamiensis]MBP2001407.1 RNA polymerase sigma-70 factor (ECF subfamily) [Paenibacillus shirakamiensis]